MNLVLFTVLLSIGVAGVVLCLFRGLKGPTASDRAVGVDGMITITTALMVLIGLFLKSSIYLDVSLVYAVLAFIGIIAIARYLERGL